MSPAWPTWHGREIVALMGAPGSGKSTLAAQWPVSVTTDVLRSVDRTPQGDLPTGAMAAAYERAFDFVVQALKRNQTVLLDSPLANPDTRQHVLRIARTYRAKATLIVLRTPVETCIERQAERTHPVPIDVVRKMHAAIAEQYPSLPNEGWSSIVWR